MDLSLAAVMTSTSSLVVGGISVLGGLFCRAFCPRLHVTHCDRVIDSAYCNASETPLPLETRNYR